MIFLLIDFFFQKKGLRHLESKGLIKLVTKHARQLIYTRAIVAQEEATDKKEKKGGGGSKKEKKVEAAEEEEGDE